MFNLLACVFLILLAAHSGKADHLFSRDVLLFERGIQTVELLQDSNFTSVILFFAQMGHNDSVLYRMQQTLSILSMSENPVKITVFGYTFEQAKYFKTICALWRFFAI